MTTPTVLQASNEAELNSAIAEVDAAQSGSFLIEITDDSISLSTDIQPISLANIAVKLEISGAAAPGGGAVIDGGDDYVGFETLTPGVTIDPTVISSDTVSSSKGFEPASFDDLLPGSVIALPDILYHLDDQVWVHDAALAASFDAALEYPANTSPGMPLLQGTQASAGDVPVAMAAEDGRGGSLQVVSLEAAPMSFSRFVELGVPAITSGAYFIQIGAAGVAAGLDVLNQFKRIAGLIVTGGASVLEGGETFDQSYVQLDSGTLAIAEPFLYTGDMSNVGGDLMIVKGKEAIFTGVLNDLGTIDGLGTLATAAGADMTIGMGGSVGVADWLNVGHNTSVNIASDEQLTYAGEFWLGNGATVNVESNASLELPFVATVAGIGGTLEVSAASTLTVDHFVGPNEVFDLTGADDLLPATALLLNTPQAFRGTIDEMGSDSFVGVTGDWNLLSAPQSGNTVTLNLINAAGNEVAHIAFTGNFTASQFHLHDALVNTVATTAITYS